MKVTTLAAWMKAKASCEATTSGWLAGSVNGNALMHEELSLVREFSKTTVPEFYVGSSKLSALACNARKATARAQWLLRLCVRANRDSRYTNPKFEMVDPTAEEMSALRRGVLFAVMKEQRYEIDSPDDIELASPHLWEI